MLHRLVSQTRSEHAVPSVTSVPSWCAVSLPSVSGTPGSLFWPVPLPFLLDLHCAVLRCAAKAIET